MPAALDHAYAPAHLVARRGDERVVRAEHGELLRRVVQRQVRRAERHETPDQAASLRLHEVARDEPAETVADDVDLRGAGLLPYLLDVRGEVARDPLVVEARAVREAREPPNAIPRQMSPQNAEVRRITEDAVHEHDGHRMVVGVAERVDAEPAARERAHDLRERGELAGGAHRRPGPAPRRARVVRHRRLVRMRHPPPGFSNASAATAHPASPRDRITTHRAGRTACTRYDTPDGGGVADRGAWG